MVVTRSAARAAAAAAAAAAENATAVTSSVAPKSIAASDSAAPGASLASERQQPSIKTQIRRAMWTGHAIALVAVATAIHAALQQIASAAPDAAQPPPTAPPYRPLPQHALVLLLCIVPLRLHLAALYRAGAAALAPQWRGAHLAQHAAPLFASNALHILAILHDPDRRLALLLGPAALNAAAVWLRMAVAAREGEVEGEGEGEGEGRNDDDNASKRAAKHRRSASVPAGRVLSLRGALLANAADLHLATAVAGHTLLEDVLAPLFWLRVLADARVLLASAVAIVRTDETAKKVAAAKTAVVSKVTGAISRIEPEPTED